MKTPHAALLAVLLLQMGCPGGGPAVTCNVDGKTYRAGVTFPSPDGCNTCTCGADGNAACTEKACVATDGGPDASGPGADLADNSVMCVGLNQTFPTFDKRCSIPADCIRDFHQVDCCGSLKAIGMHKSERDQFQQAEARCRAMYPGCGCAAQPTLAEDGKRSGDHDNITVACLEGGCTSLVK